MTTATWTNPETGKKLTVFVHALIEERGEQEFCVNKGEVKTHYTFRVLARDTDMVLA